MMSNLFKTLWLLGASLYTFLIFYYFNAPYIMLATAGAFVTTGLIIYVLEKAYSETHHRHFYKFKEIEKSVLKQFKKLNKNFKPNFLINTNK